MSGDGLDAPSPAVVRTRRTVEETLGASPAFKRVDDDLYVVKQGSAYVMIQVLPWHRAADQAVVRCVAQMVTGIEMDGDLAIKLLTMNSLLRFGSFTYVPEDRTLLLEHSILGGEALTPEQLRVAVTDVAIIADDWDDRIIAEYGGRTMEDVITDEALTRIALSIGGPATRAARTPWDDPPGG